MYFIPSAHYPTSSRDLSFCLSVFLSFLRHMPSAGNEYPDFDPYPYSPSFPPSHSPRTLPYRTLLFQSSLSLCGCVCVYVCMSLGIDHRIHFWEWRGLFTSCLVLRTVSLVVTGNDLGCGYVRRGEVRLLGDFLWGGRGLGRFGGTGGDRAVVGLLADWLTECGTMYWWMDVIPVPVTSLGYAGVWCRWFDNGCVS